MVLDSLGIVYLSSVPGELVLVGPNLPHLWRNDASYTQDGASDGVKTIVLKFTRDFIGNGTFDRSEFVKINQLLQMSKYGVYFDSTISAAYHEDLLNMPNLSPVQQSIKLLSMLDSLALENDKTLLSTSDMRQMTTDNSHRIDTVLKYISDNYVSDICLDDVADIACMTTNSFCRFFKRMTNKSFTRFLNEVRIKNASRLLVQENVPVSEVCYMVGFNTITNFNKQFKQIMGRTPSDYRCAV
ncbi:AraC family transcriptional regulator [Reichenbachiella carrageenanivorans]|uniref:AraC family transcriptional regulator n=1 Tax=Reichenbachiella carrageenanivorans TaxID=2979869 RepID=A0ABY6CZP4_9BACT|nr:AraC family transcriptional regulator [Reichenbachiella carrageenanivorans]UXX79382.1 AraC family transcriptional regulator [Reichenbachiella carrageenanivorans]